MQMYRLFLCCSVVVSALIVVVPSAMAQRMLEESLDLRSSLPIDETLVLFTTPARRSVDGKRWLIPIHGWVYKPQHSRIRKALVASLLNARYGLEVTAAVKKYFDRRVNLLLADNKEHRRIIIEAGGHRFAMPETGDNGHFRSQIALSAQDVATFRTGDHLSFFAALPKGDPRHFGGEVLLVEPAGLSIISDIDDTVKLTHVTDHKRMFEQTFYKPFAAVPGMAEAYSGLQKSHQTTLHFVSSSPWHLYQPLQEFLQAEGFPLATISLKQIRLKDSSIFNLFKDGTETKPPQITALLMAYPGRKFILVGDSGEKDPETYAALMRRFPKQILRTLIRNVTGAKRDDARFSKVFAGIAAHKWRLISSAKAITEKDPFAAP